MISSPRKSVVSSSGNSEQTDLLSDGYVFRSEVINADLAVELGNVIDRIALTEQRCYGTSPVEGNGYYVRDLIWKDERFHRFICWEETLDVARTLIGPRLRVAIDARVAGDSHGATEVPWHIHTPAAATDHPWATEPQTMACLVYLDDVTELEGALGVLPGSHIRRLTAKRASEESAAGGEVLLYPSRGDLVIMHGNLWHRVVAARRGRGARRVLFVGYGPAWMTLDPAVQGQPDQLPRPVKTINWPDGGRIDKQEQDDLLGRFRW